MVWSSSISAGITALMTCSMISFLISARTSVSSDFPFTSGSCWVEMTTVWTRTGLSSSYSSVTWLLLSGSSQASVLFSRSVAMHSTRRCERWIGSGISSSVSSQA